MKERNTEHWSNVIISILKLQQLNKQCKLKFRSTGLQLKSTGTYTQDN